MIVRLTTDASLCEETRTGAWGAIVRGRNGYMERGSAFAGKFSGINGLEMHAIAMGLRMAVDHGALAPGDHLVLQTDSSHAAHRMRPDYISRRNRRRLKRGQPIPVADIGSQIASPCAWARATLSEIGITHEVVLSSDGRDIAVADKIAHQHMAEERARRRGLLPMDAKLDVFERAMDRGRMEWLKATRQL